MPQYNYEQYLEKFDELSKKVTERRSHFETFVSFLRERTSYFYTPASTIYHLNIEHGLFFHSVGVTETLLKIKNVLAPELSDESCVICGLFHDCGKAGFPGDPLYIKTEKGYKMNYDIVELQIAIRSLYIISNYVPLKTDEAQAIAYHDGQYIPQGRDVAHRETPLLTMLHFADFYTAHILETDLPIKHGEYIKKFNIPE
ncbi:MAG TPA: HD domain-containing protein [Candidatus Wallbacteria bacterium]|nr:HD domain-containing protein [Candidatus Wallbacteria bacterium]